MEKLALAAFLHDIGKFRQRAGLEISEELKSQYCPSNKSNYSHLHAAHSVEAIDEMGLRIKKEDLAKIIRLAASHHLSNLEGDEEIVQIADRYASRLDRKESEEKSHYIESALMTPFSYIKLQYEPIKSYYPLQKLDGKIEISLEEKVNSKEKYKKLYEDFIKEVRNAELKFDNLEDFLILKSIYEKYTTFIPSATYLTYPDVSLFDHSLATAAIAVAIKNGNKEEFSLIQGDFTSIQSFIFSKEGESNKNIAKILRAKSLFVSMLTEMVALRIIRELNLSVFNIVLNAGGKFTILAHKLKNEDFKKLGEIKKEVNELFKNLNFLQTKFIIGSIDFKKDKFKLGEFKDVFKDMALKFEEEKLKFDSDVNVFRGYFESMKAGKCEVCGIHPKEEGGFCKYCDKFRKIGEKLPKAKYVKLDLDNFFEGFDITFSKPDGIYFSFDEHPIKRVANYVPRFSEDEDLQKYKKLLKDKAEIDVIEKNKIKTFYHIAADGVREDLSGRKYLAVLKADVDNLGKIFINGFGNNSTFSRTLYLSRMLDYFFTTELMQEVNGKNIYTVFAGGDDLFLIGHYEDIIKIYDWIIKRFRDYTRNNNFHLSAAIRLFEANVPVNLIAELAEEELKDAKNLGRDRVVIFGEVFKNSEFEELVNKKTDEYREILKLLKENKSGISFLYRMYEFIEMRKLENSKNLDEFLRGVRWRSLFRYLVYKNFEKNYVRKRLEVLSKDIESLEGKMVLPLNLVMYENRTY